MTDIVIRPLKEEDVTTVLDTAVAAWAPIFASFRELLGHELFDAAFPKWQAEKRRQVASACRGEHGAVVVVAEVAGKPVGFASFYVNAQTRVGEIGNNAVIPEYQSQGIGTQLYDHVLTQMRAAGMDAARVSTGGDASHAPARRAYEKAGFTRAIPEVTYYLDLRSQ